MKIITLKRFTFKRDGRFNRFAKLAVCTVAIALGISRTAHAASTDDPHLTWPKFQTLVEKQKQDNSITGISYIISGSIAVVGGFVGQGLTKDPLEGGVYTLFQTIGIASIGYGAYQWKIGNDDRFFLDTVNGSKLSLQDKYQLLESYQIEKLARERQERIIRAITHGLIAALNIYDAVKQPKGPVKNVLFFVGGINLLAAVSFTF